MHISGNRAFSLAVGLASLAYIVGDYTQVEVLRIVGAFLAQGLVCLLVFVFGWALVRRFTRNRRIRRDVKARVDRLAEPGW